MKNNEYKILILEDNRDTLHNLREFLSYNGIMAIGSESIEEAMKIFNKRSWEINLFIIDLRLPDGNGMDFLKTIRDEPNSAELSPIPKAIITSHFITENIRKIGRQLGVIAYFEKPFNLYELKKEVIRAVKTI